MDKQRHRLPRLNYIPRIIFISFAALITAIAVRGQPYGVFFWAAWVVYFFTWPHIAYFRTRFSRNPKQAEFNNALFDSFTIGIWAAISHFMLSVLFLFFAGTALTNLTLRGGKILPYVVLLFASGLIVGGLITGFQVQLTATILDQGIGFAGMVIVMFIIGYNSFLQNHTLVKIKQSIEEKNRIFRALGEMGILTHQAKDITELIHISLDHMANSLQEPGFGIILHDPNRPGSVRYARFLGISDQESRAVFQRLLARKEKDGGSFIKIDMPRPPGTLIHAIPMTAHLKELAGYLVIKTEHDIPQERTPLFRLFRDQMASILESNLLTLRLERLANTDSLTGAYNREYLKSAFKTACDNKKSIANVDFSVVSVDLNGLKKVNDLYGHEIGDAIVISSTDLLRSVIRKTDILFRMGGDEFLVLCNNCDSFQCGHLLERIRGAENQAWVSVRTNDGETVNLPVRFSIGHAGSDEMDTSLLMQVADERMYADKIAYYETHARYR